MITSIDEKLFTTDVNLTINLLISLYVILFRHHNIHLDIHESLTYKELFLMEQDCITEDVISCVEKFIQYEESKC